MNDNDETNCSKDSRSDNTGSDDASPFANLMDILIDDPERPDCVLGSPEDIGRGKGVTVTFKAHFDGKVLVPDEPVQLPVGTVLNVAVMETRAAPVPSRVESEGDGPLAGLDRYVADVTEADGYPADFSQQHDHYLYGTPKK